MRQKRGRILICSAMMTIFASLATAATYKGQIISEFAPDEFAVVLFPNGKSAPVKPLTFKTSQKDKNFRPPLLVIPQGSSVEFFNDDAIKHNAWSMSQVRRFDLGMLDEGEDPRIKFEKIGIVEVFCNIHAKMYMMIWVVDSPFYTTPDNKYNFTIADVPEGSYKVEVRHYLSSTQEQIGELIVKGDKIQGPTAFEFKKDAAPAKKERKKRRKTENDY